MLELVYSGNLQQAYHYLDLEWPAGISGKESFRADFTKQLERGVNWPEIEALNRLPAAEAQTRSR
jgi:hypothetical protein